jgi:hypothetical protein
MKNKFKMWWKGFFMTSEEKYLSESADTIDLENRLRSMEYGRSESGRWMNRTGRSDTKYWL